MSSWALGNVDRHLYNFLKLNRPKHGSINPENNQEVNKKSSSAAAIKQLLAADAAFHCKTHRV